MRAVITGGAGFLGSHLCDRMIAEGWDVLALDNLVTGVGGQCQRTWQETSTFELVRGDVSEQL